MITAVRDQVELRRLAWEAGQELETATAQEILTWAAETFGEGLAVTASMQDTVLAHMASKVAPGIDILFLDTGYHFIETIGTADAVEAVYDVNLRRLLPLQTVAEQDAQYGPRLHDRDPDLCCALRKVAPLNSALAEYEAWATGVRRDESPARAKTPVVGFDAKKGRVKIAPLAAWTEQDVLDYAEANGVLMNPLLQLNYPSIGCEPCTRAVAPGEDARAGRWAGSAKTECGLHK